MSATLREVARTTALLLIVATTGGCRGLSTGPSRRSAAQRLEPGPAAHPRTPTDGGGATPAALVEADLMREAASEAFPPLPAGASLRVECCTLFGYSAVPSLAHLVLTLPHSGLESPATALVGAAYRVTTEGPARIVARPDFGPVRRALPAIAAEARIALRVAYATVTALPHYRDWQRRGLHTHARMQGDLQPDRGRWTVYFVARAQPDGGVEASVELSVDVRGEAVLAAYSGPGRTAITLPAIAADRRD